MVSKFARSRHTTTPHKNSLSGRGKTVVFSLYLGLFAILSRLFYWQIIQGTILRAQAENQYQRVITAAGTRGEIFTSDGYLLVGNDTRYHVVGYPYLAEKPTKEIVDLLTPLLLPEMKDYRDATESTKQEELKKQLTASLTEKLSRKEAKWVSLFPNISADTEKKIAEYHMPGIGFETHPARYYPEASMAAHLLGFLGKDDQGKPVGYFGVEGGLDKELGGRAQKKILSLDALGFSLSDQGQSSDDTQGRDAVLTIRRDIQHLAEEMLKKGMERYGAEAGEIIIVEPSTGKILALAAEPKYDPIEYQEYDSTFIKNPALSSLYEPGSVLKTLTVSAGIDAGVIEPDTHCDSCDGPRQIGKYTIRTWNDEYHPDITMTDALAKSDNIAMIFIAEKLGEEKYIEYLHNFGIGESSGIELHEDQSTPFPDKWGPVELATRSFGQGITVNSLQMMTVVSTIANQGTMMRPQIVEKVIEPGGKEIPVDPKSVRQVIKPETAQKVTDMMINAAQHGEAQWIYSKTHSVAGKTGTSQIPKEEGGGYQEDVTIASFIGFAPPKKPRFVMMVKLVKPKSSPWAAETAAPLWYQTAEKLFLLLNVPADQN